MRLAVNGRGAQGALACGGCRAKSARAVHRRFKWAATALGAANGYGLRAARAFAGRRFSERRLALYGRLGESN
ncbi:hypothetical protein BSIN_3868 [Burkholderia singularis]|uniref:Uncharacterized protein n=1 Tax=Burkholderia singularis TaxID=1503053 RepID=A0A238H786_9BURK|nr:hypothetical protein AQ611_07575 [Burkholderia sp. Bp7605]SMG00887.1 hypothetical protein BSIN_3868 [Burkholderia singularis]